MKTLQIANLIAVIVTVTINILSQALPFNNQTSAEIANRFTDNYFLPANYVFGIWGIIYTAMLIFAVYQARRERPIVQSFGWWWVIGCVGNVTWLIAFHWNLFALSMIPMVLLLVSLMAIYLKLRAPGISLSRQDRWFVGGLISLYAAWVTVATISNACYILIDAGWDGFGLGYETWGVIMIVVGGLIAGAVALVNRDAVYASVIVWSFTGILARHPDMALIAVSAGVLSLIVGAIGIFGIITRLGSGGGAPLRTSQA